MPVKKGAKGNQVGDCTNMLLREHPLRQAAPIGEIAVTHGRSPTADYANAGTVNGSAAQQVSIR